MKNQKESNPVEPDINQRFVRFQNKTDQGFIEFEFGVGDPEYMVELILPEEAYLEFCELNSVIEISSDEGLALDRARERWQFGETVA